MGEITRQRRARDLWISRGHLWALGVGIVLLVVCSFFLGLGLSRGQAAAPSTGHVGRDTPDESLVDLLARVDARVVSQDGVDTLTFPDTLTGLGQDPELPAVRADASASSTVAAGGPGGGPADLILEPADEAAAERLTGDLRARGWRVTLSRDPVQLAVQGGADVAATRDARERLLVDLEGLDVGLPVEIRLR